MTTIEAVDLVLMNDAEIRMFTEEANRLRAARSLRSWAPRRRGQAGRVRGGPVHGVDFFALPAYPLETVNDPTGAGDSFAGGFLGYLASHGEDAAEDPGHSAAR